MIVVSKLLDKFKTRIIPFVFTNGNSVPGNLRENELIGSIANAIATNVGKLSPQVIRKDSKGMTIKNDPLSKLLNIRPCLEMSTYDFLYRIASDLVYTSNAFAILFYDESFLNITSIQPVTVTRYNIFEDAQGNIFFKFTWDYDNKEYTVPYQSVIHIKGRYNKKRFMGTPPDLDLQSTLDLLETTYQGIKNSVKNSATLRGYLKYNNFIDDKTLQQKVNEFQTAYMSASNEGGIGGLDNAMEFKEITQRPATIQTLQMQFFRENIYRYYNLNEKILTSTANAEEWNAFYENVIEPIAIQLSLEFMFKCLTERERGFGNKIIFTANRLQYASIDTRLKMIEALFDRGLMTINEGRDIMYLPPVEDGDVRMISLNYVNVDNQDIYQVGKGGGSSAKFVKQKILGV
ncbi:MAG: phage portal protein [Eubacterium sp.]|nr:phage portal protein [Eubacterium sp.]